MTQAELRLDEARKLAAAEDRRTASIDWCYAHPYEPPVVTLKKCLAALKACIGDDLNLALIAVAIERALDRLKIEAAK